MKVLALRLAMIMGVTAVTGLSVSAAPNAPAPIQVAAWCAVTNLGTENCHFTSQAQCALSVSGVGGICRMAADATGLIRRLV